MSTVLDYVGRRYDALALPGAQPTGDVQLQQALFNANSSGQICTGIQKLSQRWVLEFMTEVGSMQFLPTRGCQFMRDVRLGHMRTEADVETSFRFSMIDVRQQLVGEESADMAADERYDRAELLAIEISPGMLSLSVRIWSLAGETREVILPIDVLA